MRRYAGRIPGGSNPSLNNVCPVSLQTYAVSCIVITYCLPSNEGGNGDSVLYDLFHGLLRKTDTGHKYVVRIRKEGKSGLHPSIIKENQRILTSGSQTKDDRRQTDPTDKRPIGSTQIRRVTRKPELNRTSGTGDTPVPLILFYCSFFPDKEICRANPGVNRPEPSSCRFFRLRED